MKLSEELKWRGFLNQTTFKNIEQIDQEKFTLYLGVDPTGDSLHIGHLAVYMLVRRFLDRGHNVVLLFGGGTGMIGDPGGREDERQILSQEQVKENVKKLQLQVKKLFSNKDFISVDNYDWLKDLNILTFLREVGKNFSMSTLLQRDFIASRIGEGGKGISYAEFSYTLLQGYDYYYLNKNNGVNLQIGGSDQWGNILSGVDLVRKKSGNEVNGMTAPLVLDQATGKKFGKSVDGAVFLDENKTSVYKLYQFWLNINDESAISYLKLFTLLNKEEIDDIEERHNSAPNERLAQKTLALTATSLIHGADRAESVVRVSAVLFGGAKFDSLSQEDIDNLAKEIPEAKNNQSITDILIESKIATSKGEARRLLSAGSISINGEKVTTDQQIAETSLIKKGKNNFALVR